MKFWDSIKNSNSLLGRYISIVGFGALMIGLVLGYSNDSTIQSCIFSTNIRFEYDKGPLKTNSEVGIIDLFEDTQSAGFDKNEIQPITIENLNQINSDMFNCLKSDYKFIVVEFDGNNFAYPIGILERHQIINHKIGDKYINLTFSPYSNSLNVFVTKDIFTNSGRILYANSLILDDSTESMWLQLTGDAVIGNRTGEKLEKLSFKLMSKSEISNIKEIQIMTLDTGYRYNYSKDIFEYYKSHNIIYPNIINDEENIKDIVIFDTITNKIVDKPNPSTVEVYKYTAQKIAELSMSSE